MQQIKDRWEEIKDTIRKEYDLSDVSYHTWIEPLQFHKVDNDTVLILIPSDQSHALNYISSKYKDFFRVTISEMMNHNYNVSFLLENDVETTDPKEAAGTLLPTYNINHENAHLNPEYNFDTFVVGNNNKFAHSACVAVAESPGKAYNPLFIYGGPGLGKTHLMHSIGHYVLDHMPDKKVLYVDANTYTNEVIECIRSGNANRMPKLREKYCSIDVLMIDDIQFIIGRESTQEEFFYTFNTLHAAGKQIILSSDKPPKEMKSLEERYRSRFEWGLIADISAPDYETRMAILRRKAETCEKHIDDAVFQYIAINFKSNIRKLEGAYNRIIAKSKLENKSDITLDLAVDALKDMVNSDEPEKITPERIVAVVAEHYQVTPDDITSKKRNSEFVLPRQVVMYLCRELTDVSLANIGKLLGKDHTTVIHGQNKIADEIKTNEELKNNIDAIRKKLS